MPSNLWTGSCLCGLFPSGQAGCPLHHATMQSHHAACAASMCSARSCTDREPLKISHAPCRPYTNEAWGGHLQPSIVCVELQGTGIGGKVGCMQLCMGASVIACLQGQLPMLLCCEQGPWCETTPFLLHIPHPSYPHLPIQSDQDLSTNQVVRQVRELKGKGMRDEVRLGQGHNGMQQVLEQQQRRVGNTTKTVDAHAPSHVQLPSWPVPSAAAGHARSKQRTLKDRPSFLVCRSHAHQSAQTQRH